MEDYCRRRKGGREGRREGEREGKRKGGREGRRVACCVLCVGVVCCEVRGRERCVKTDFLQHRNESKRKSRGGRWMFKDSTLYCIPSITLSGMKEKKRVIWNKTVFTRI